MKVIENFLPEEEFKKIEDRVFSTYFPWYFQDGIVTNNDGNGKLTHLLYADGRVNSDEFSLFNPVFSKFNMLTILRAKLNCLPRIETVRENGMHKDIDTNHNFTTAIFYLNTNNGYTKFETGEKVISERNKLVVFDGHLQHSGTTNSCKTLRRVLLNINFIEEK
jgi:hypothetical protein